MRIRVLTGFSIWLLSGLLSGAGLAQTAGLKYLH
jgi:hypothetical protein